MVNTIRFGDNFKRERKINGKVKVYEGLDLVQYHIDNGQRCYIGIQESNLTLSV